MNHLYSMFAKQVQNYCKEKAAGGDASQCKKNMMMYGVTKLNGMEESHLDTMDPYQRDANNIRKSNQPWGFVIDLFALTCIIIIIARAID